MNDGRTSSKQQLGILAHIAEEMNDGFKTGIERITVTAPEEYKPALLEFLVHIQLRCDVPTAFERATQAFYLPESLTSIQPAPAWWSILTVEAWTELLTEGPSEATGNLTITCTNGILPATRGMPTIVRDEVQLLISASGDEDDDPVDVIVSGGSLGKIGSSYLIKNSYPLTDIPPISGQRTPIIYKAAAHKRKATAAKVISLASWVPGLIVTSRTASKFSPPKKPRKGKSAINWESFLSLPGSGRYELTILLSPGSYLISAASIPDDATDTLEESQQALTSHLVKEGEYQIEIEAEGKYQVDILFQHATRDKPETCRIYITCEEAKEEGCKSEFERLIKLNRRHLEKLDTKAVIQLDRHARSASLQSWILDKEYAAKSFLPLVISDDYALKWAPPDWNGEHGPILSNARFLQDPRPVPSLFQPPRGFTKAREDIAKLIRETIDQEAGLLESAPLGKWLARDANFRDLIETYLDAYNNWLASDRDVACWVDVIAVCARGTDEVTLSRVPEAIILSPLHPLRLAWHCLAQKLLHDEVEGESLLPCPAASILDPDCVPDLLRLSLQSPGGESGIERVDFLSVECNSDYWSVLWNGSRLGELTKWSNKAPFDNAFGLVVGGISSGFSPAQVSRALGDISDLLTAKPILSLVVSSAGGATDSCNEGLANWCTRRFGNGGKDSPRQGVGPKFLEVFDTRPDESRPDQAAIANLSEDTGNRVRWFDKQPAGSMPDLGIIAQLDSAQPLSTEVGMRSPLGLGGLIRHRVRRQLNGPFLSESRQGLPMPPSGNVFADKISACMVALETCQDGKIGLQFAPNVYAVSGMLEHKKAGFVAVSSSAIDPACFIGGKIKGTYLWDYDLPSYSHRAGDTSGYYLLSQIRGADRDALSRVLELLPGGRGLAEDQIEQILLEVARRGIPTVRGLSGDDTGATGDLGLFLSVRLLQDQFRTNGNIDSLVPVLSGTLEEPLITLIIPVDPFRGYLADLARSLGKEHKETTLSRPDLLVVGIRLSDSRVQIHLTPIEVKCRQGSSLSLNDAKEALTQAKSLSALLTGLQARATKSPIWKLTYQHLLLSMVGFGLRVYSQQELISQHPARWAKYHERITASILESDPSISIDSRGRLIIVDDSPESKPRDHDGDGFNETVVISPDDAGLIVCGDPKTFYNKVCGKVGNWDLLPNFEYPGATIKITETSLLLPEIALAKAAESEPEAYSFSPNQDYTLGSLKPSELAPLPPQALEIENSGVKLNLGTTVDGFTPRSLSLNISDTRLNNLNIGVVGDLGTGKTQLLKSLILQIGSASKKNRGIPPRILIFDYKRDFSSVDFVEATGARVIKPSRLPLNLFDTSTLGESVAPWLDRFRFFADVLDKVYSGIGPVQRDKLKGAVRNAYEACADESRQPTIYDVHSEYRQLLGSKSDSPMAIIDDLVDMEIFESDPLKTLPFDQFLDGIVVISLDALGQDDRSKNMLVAIMLNMFYENMLRTPKRPFIGNDPQLRVIDSYLLVDEADNIMRYEFDVLRKLLLQGREFGAGVILASQYLRHFKAGGTDYKDPLLSWFIHKVPNVTASELGALGMTSDLGELSERVKTLPNHHCLYKTFDVSGEVIRGLPFYELIKNQP